jgi:hypothetical protein
MTLAAEPDRYEITGCVVGDAGADHESALALWIIPGDPGKAYLAIQAAQRAHEPERQSATQHKSPPGRKRRGIQTVELAIVEVVVVQDTMQKYETILHQEGVAERAFPTNDFSYLFWRLLRPVALTVGRGTHDVMGNAILAQGARQTICQYRFASMRWTTNQHGWLRVFLSFHCLTPDEISG